MSNLLENLLGGPNCECHRQMREENLIDTPSSGGRRSQAMTWRRTDEELPQHTLRVLLCNPISGRYELGRRQGETWDSANWHRAVPLDTWPWWAELESPTAATLAAEGKR